MVARTDLRPTRADDSLKKLLGKVTNPQTTPHGVKVAQPGEYVSFHDTAGVAHRWDGDTIAEYDKRIAEGEVAVAEAQESLAETENTLAAAGERIAQVEQDTTPTAIGDVAAAQINERRLIIGRDAILTGTVDVAQLNVTEAMSAQIVSAMSVESKKLVVTEDAILNRATVVQSLVTPELIADRINVNSLGARLVTAGAIQTDPATDRGIKISNSGITGYSADGKQTININGSTNKIVGEFSTGFYGDPRINIYNKFNPLWGIAESVIDMQASGMSGVSSYDNAVTRLTSSPREGFTITTGGKRRLTLDNQGAVLSANYIVLDGQTTTNDLAVRGRLMKTQHLHAMESGPHTVAGNSFHDANFTFASTGHRPFIVPSVSFDDAADINISLWNVTNTTARVRVYNSGSNTVRGLYVTIIVLPLER